MLEDGLVGTSLADGVVSLALSVDGFLQSLEEKATVVILVGLANRVSTAVDVTLNDDLGTDGVNDDLRDLSPLDVHESNWKILLDLDAGGYSLLQGNEDGGLESLLHLSDELDLLSLLDITFTRVKLLFGFDKFNIFGLKYENNNIIKLSFKISNL